MAAFDFSSSFSGINNALANLGKQNERAFQMQALSELGKDIEGGNYAGAAQKALAAGDTSLGVNLLGLGQQAKDRAQNASLIQSWNSGGVPPPSASPVALGSPNEIENRFVNTVKGAGLTNPTGLAAVAAYGKAESGFAPQNVNRSWSDPSESGQPGMAGGIMSWRAERLQNLQNFAKQRGEAQPSVETQALFLAQENPQLLPALQAAKTPQEANQIMAQAWRFAGYNRPGGENARREALTTQYAQRFGGQGGAPVQVPPQVAMNEADVQRLEAQQGNPVIPQQAPVQVAQAPAATASDAASVPAQGATEAQFVIPPGQGAQTTVENDPQVKLWQQRYSQAAAVGNAAATKIAEKSLEMATRAAERRYNEGKAPEAVREWQWARQNGLTEAKSPVAYAKEKAEATRADTAPVVRQLKQADGSEVAVQWNPDNRTWEPLAAPQGGEAVKPKGQKLTEGQSKDLIFHNRGLQALETFEPLSDAYAVGKDRLISQVPGGNYAVPQEFQMAQQAGRNFLASILRKDSGAAITAPEEKQYGDIFLPQPGDKPGTLAQKADARKQAIDAIRNGLGTAEVLALGQRLTTRNPGEAAPEKQATPGAPPKRGELMDGYRFKGGDPSKPDSWVKVP